MSTFVALSVSALAYGAALALAALGFLMLHKVSGVVNFAHGDLVTLGGYPALWFIADFHAAPLLGYLGAFAPLRRRPHLDAGTITETYEVPPPGARNGR